MAIAAIATGISQLAMELIRLGDGFIAGMHGISWDTSFMGNRWAMFKKKTWEQPWFYETHYCNVL